MQPDSPPQNYLWNVLKSLQSYRNIVYLVLTFPFGLLYFIMLAMGLSLGVGMAIIGVGLLILWGTLAFSSVLGNFERWLSNKLLRTHIPMQHGNQFKLSDRRNWRSAGYLALKFPLGLMTFIFTTFIVALNIGMIFMPLNYGGLDVNFVFAREIDTLWEAIVSSIFGIVLAPFTLILLGKIALMWRDLNLNLLRNDEVVETEKQKNLSREEIEQDVINRLIDEGVIQDESLVSQVKKKNRYSE